jgi:nicotinate-nucleotide adenylyltransferase
VTVVPAGRNPLREDPVAEGFHRLAMARVAVAGLAGVEVDGREIRQSGPSYTVNTLAALVRAQPGDRWRLVVGADNLGDLPRWRDLSRVLRLAELLVVPRDGWDGRLPAELVPRAVIAHGFAHPARATTVRAALAAGRRPADLPPPVADYIRRHGLYGTGAARPEPEES